MALQDGLYDLLISEGLARSLAALEPGSAEVRSLNGGVTERLVDAITRQLGAILDHFGGDDAERAGRQLELVNEILVALRHRLAAGHGASATGTAAEVVDLIAPPPRVLRSVRRDRQFPPSPEIGLAAPWLFTAGKGSPSLLQEIRRELASADQVDILVSFITVSGVRKLQDVLQQITATGAQGQSAARLRILTTTVQDLDRALHVNPGLSNSQPCRESPIAPLRVDRAGRPRSAVSNACGGGRWFAQPQRHR